MGSWSNRQSINSSVDVYFHLLPQNFYANDGISSKRAFFVAGTEKPIFLETKESRKKFSAEKKFSPFSFFGIGLGEPAFFRSAIYNYLKLNSAS